MQTMKNLTIRLAVFLAIAALFFSLLMTCDGQPAQAIPDQNHQIALNAPSFQPVSEQMPKPIFANNPSSPILAVDQTSGGINLTNIAEHGIVSLVVIALFYLVVSPLIKVLVNSLDKLPKAITDLIETIGKGQKEYLESSHKNKSTVLEKVEQEGEFTREEFRKEIREAVRDMIDHIDKKSSV